ncbi:guanylate kinase [Acinetobacter nosocomialis]|uniref:guanylate kinase n=1 Tax=Acinetobacter nosocomialis TaxID=106654 RepID=UPI0033AB177F
MFVLLSGTTCSGKTTIADTLTEKYGFMRIVTTTSRPKREGEIDGWHYHFVTQAEFDALKKAGQFLETNKHGNYEYGVGIDKFQNMPENRNAVLIIEPNGYKKIKRYLKANEIKYLGAFVDADIRSRLNRLIVRADQKLAERLEVMIKVESHWINEIDQYDMLIQNDCSIEGALMPILDHVQRAGHFNKIA